MRLLMLSLVAALLGCSSAEVPETHFYLFRADAPLQPNGSDLVVGIGAVDIAAYLNRSEVLMQVGPQELRPARHHRWAEPLDRNVQRYLRDRLAAALGNEVLMSARSRESWDLQIDVVVEEFHGSASGQSLLRASYVVRRTAAPDDVQRGRVGLSESHARDGYSALVDAQSRLLDAMALRIAADVRAMAEAGG